MQGSVFYRIIDKFIDQTGAGTDSVWGGQFKVRWELRLVGWC